MPLYKEAKIETEIKEWVSKHMKQFETDFKRAMQLSEREIMNSFKFKNKLKWGGSI
jgi:hypothetical protein